MMAAEGTENRYLGGKGTGKRQGPDNAALGHCESNPK
jgi:hypothetical protein